MAAYTGIQAQPKRQTYQTAATAKPSGAGTIVTETGNTNPTPQINTQFAPLDLSGGIGGMRYVDPVTGATPSRPPVQGPVLDTSSAPGAFENPVNRYQREAGQTTLDPNKVYYNFRSPNAGLAGSGTIGTPLYGGLNYRYGEAFNAQTNDPREWLYGGRMNPGQESQYGSTALMSPERRRLVEAIINRGPNRYAMDPSGRPRTKGAL